MIKPFYFGEKKEKIASDFVPVDDWVAEPNDQWYITTRGNLWVPVAQILGFDVQKEPDRELLNAFVLASKRCYNGRIMREHIPQYLNYFEKFYDLDKELLWVTSVIKMTIDTNEKSYLKDQFIIDIRRYVLSPSLCSKAHMMVEDNYMLDLDSKHYKHDKNAALIYKDRHAKWLLWISLMMNMCIPLVTHYIHKTKIKDPNKFILEVYNYIFMLCPINMYNKLCETSGSNVDKNSKRNEKLWSKQDIRGKTVTTHSLDSVNNVILNIIPKYNYKESIVFFNYASINKNTYFQITGIEYEYTYVPLDSAIKDSDNNSIFDKFESFLPKQNEALILQNNCACEETMKYIDLVFGPFSEDDINFYIKRLTDDLGNIVNEFQMELVFNLFYKYFGDVQTIRNINMIDYVKLIISAKRLLIANNFTVLPYIISGKFERIQSKKTISKSETDRLKSTPFYDELQQIYNDEKIMLYILGLAGTILTSKFRIIDPDDPELDGKLVDKDKMSDLILAEVSGYVTLITR